MAIILETRQLTKRFGELAAVKDLSFQVEEGQIFGIAGPNGAGKTTLFNVISGVYTGTGGILFQGRPIHGRRPHQICRMGLTRTFQTPAVFSSLTVYQNVLVGAHFGDPGSSGFATEDDNIRDVIQMVGLTGKEDVTATHLSLFDKKMTMLGAALATRPRLLMLDEPIGGLSPIEIERSVETFTRIRQELGVTLVVIEHLMKFLMSFSDTMMILHNGENICIGTPAEVACHRQVVDVYLGADYA